MIGNQKYDLISSNLHDIQYLNTFEACLKLLLTLQSGLRQNEDLGLETTPDTKV